MFQHTDDIWCVLCGDGMKDTYIVLQGKRFDCCRYCKSLTIGDTSSYCADSNSHVREVYEND